MRFELLRSHIGSVAYRPNLLQAWIFAPAGKCKHLPATRFVLRADIGDIGDFASAAASYSGVFLSLVICWLPDHRQARDVPNVLQVPVLRPLHLHLPAERLWLQGKRLHVLVRNAIAFVE